MNKNNQNITFRGNKLTASGSSIKEGEKLPPFKLVNTDLGDTDSESFAGKNLVLLSIPSLDTPVCQVETKRFNEEAAKLGDDVVVVAVSLDLPFAQKRWCGAEGINRVTALSDYKYRTFGESFGTYIKEMGLLARAVFVADREGNVRHVEYVTDISQEPDYDAAISCLKSLK